MAFSVQQRSKELAIRAALGASPLDVQELVVMQTLKLTLWGTVTEIPLAIALASVTIGMIFGIRSWDPVVLVLVAVLLCAVSLLAALKPSVQASRVNASAALRS